MNQTKRFLSRHSALSVLGSLALLGCSAGDKPDTDTVQVQRGLNDAPDGDLTTATPNLQVNSYARLTADAAVSATTITVMPAQLTAMNLKVGDLIMIMQMQGATISTTDDNTYGTIMNTGGAGRYELIGVKGVNTTTGVITVDNLCNGLKNAYSVAGNTQVIRVPQYATLTVNSPGSLTVPPWDGARGGVLALRARRVNLTASSQLRATAVGFRGGNPDKAGPSATDTTTFFSTDPTTGGSKGEGIAGFFANHYGRGAEANGGGGGNAFGAGGGGGANGGSATGWKGNGVMASRNANDNTAWALDPETIANANNRTNEGGGGRGGYTQAFSVMDESALTKGPGNTDWGGNLRRERGGRGGSPVANNPSSQLFLGGGGGAGAPIVDVVSGATVGIGGRGGGLIYVLAGKVEGSGSISARGQFGADLQAPTKDGAGGGGAGGTIVLNASTVSGTLQLDASGGGGGGQYDSAGVPSLLLEAEGPGGGGGGGYIAVPQGTPGTVQQNAAAGQSAITESALLSEFPSNGATDGKAGLTGQALGATPICAPADLRISVTDGITTDNQGTRITYVVTVYNDGPFTAVAAPITSTITGGLSGIEWSCSATAPSSDSGPASCATAQGTGDVAVAVTLPAGATASLLIRVPISLTTTGAVQLTANIGVPPDVNDVDTSNNSDSDTTTIGPEADLRMRATVAPAMTKTGQPLTYVLAVQNAGPNTANNVVMTFDIPPSATVVSDPIGDGWKCSVADGLLTCLRMALARGAAPDVTLTIKPEPTAAFATGSARVSSDSADPDLSNNSATAVATIEYDPNGFSTVSLAGGGIACSQTPRGNAQPFALAAALLATALLLRRRARRDH